MKSFWQFFGPAHEEGQVEGSATDFRPGVDFTDGQEEGVIRDGTSSTSNLILASGSCMSLWKGELAQVTGVLREGRGMLSEGSKAGVELSEGSNISIMSKESRLSAELTWGGRGELTWGCCALMKGNGAVGSGIGDWRGNDKEKYDSWMESGRAGATTSGTSSSMAWASDWGSMAWSKLEMICSTPLIKFVCTWNAYLGCSDHQAWSMSHHRQAPALYLDNRGWDC